MLLKKDEFKWNEEATAAKVVKIAILTRHGRCKTNSDRKNGS
jgi:hypothetical protein